MAEEDENKITDMLNKNIMKAKVIKLLNFRLNNNTNTNFNLKTSLDKISCLVRLS